MPYSSQCGTHRYCCRVVCCLLPGVWCSAGDYLSEVFVWWGILRSPSPIRGGGWGHCVWWGGIVWWGGMVSEGRVVRYCPSRLCVGVPLVWCWCPPFVCVVAVLNGGVWCVCVPRLVLHPCLLAVSPVFALSRLPCIVLLLSLLCVGCHSIVGLVVR